MNSILIFGIVIVSTILWLKYLDHLDYYKTDKRTTRIVYIGLAAGMISMIPTFILYDVHYFLFQYFITGPFYYNFLIVGLSEELAKYLMLAVVVIFFNSIKEPQDGIIQGAAVGAGFAALENIKYGFEYGPVNTLIRSFLCTGGHMLYTALAGYFLAAAVYSNIEVRDRRSVWIALFAFIPTAFIHGLYNASFDWEYLYDDLYSNLSGLSYLVDAVALIITVQIFRSLIEHSPYFVHPYSRHKQAIRAILKGLKLNPSSFVLNRRLGLYFLAAGKYKHALKRIRYCRRRQPKKANVWDVVEGIALIGSGKDDAGLQMISLARDNFAKGEKFRIEVFLQRIIRDAGLKLRVSNILNPRVFRHNHYFDRIKKYGKKHYWKSDSRLLREKLEELSELLQKQKGSVSAPTTVYGNSLFSSHG
jgi:RsiW-degrading membrane proteinase PrsW (M82 family)